MRHITTSLLLVAVPLKSAAQLHYWNHTEQLSAQYGDEMHHKYSGAYRFQLILPNTTIGRVKTFMGESSVHLRMEGDSEWNAFIPGDGLVKLAEGGQVFMPTMLHEIKCINIIRERIVALGRQPESEVRNVRRYQLADHCVNYLRQMFLCHSDPTVEIIFGKPGNAYGGLQSCWDWEEIYRGVSVNQVSYPDGD